MDNKEIKRLQQLAGLLKENEEQEDPKEMSVEEYRKLVQSVVDDILRQDREKETPQQRKDRKAEEKMEKKKDNQSKELDGIVRTVYNMRPNEGYAVIADPNFRMSLDSINQAFKEDPLMKKQIQSAIKKSSQEWKDRFEGDDSEEKFVGDDNVKAQFFLHLVWSQFLKDTKADDFKLFARLNTGKVGNIYLLIGIYIVKKNLFPF
jgi:hypothetical protein